VLRRHSFADNVELNGAKQLAPLSCRCVFRENLTQTLVIMLDLKELTIASVNDAISFTESAEFNRLSIQPDIAPPEIPIYREPFGLWFRGQAQFDNLQPSVFRSGVGVDETSMTYDFMLHAATAEARCANTFDWLCLMRHYELPTRLLDWTENLLVALFFAAQEPDKSNGHLFVLNASKLNRLVRRLPVAMERELPHRTAHGSIAVPWSVDTALRAEMSLARSFQDFTDQIASFDRNYIQDGVTFARIQEGFQTQPLELLDLLARPVAVFPKRLDARMTLQQSVFTIHGGKRYRDTISRSEGVTLLPNPVELNEMRPESKDEFLLHLEVGGNHKENIRRRLHYMGIHEASLFPEMDKLSSYVTKRWKT
jgi:hypothetical protein